MQNDEIRNSSKKDAAGGGSDHPLNDYVGKFEHPGYESVEVESRENTLVLSYCSNSFVLSHKCYDSFMVKKDDDKMFVLFPACSFTRDYSGDVSELRIPFEPSVDAIVFKKKINDKLLATNYLSRFEGSFAGDSFTLDVVLQNSHLVALVQNRSEESTLLPVKNMLFKYKEDPNSAVCFTSDSDGKVTGVLLNTSYGLALNLKKK